MARDGLLRRTGRSPRQHPRPKIKKAFRKLARDHHPDANEGDPDAEAKFKDVNQAYEVLGDRDTRKEYDHARDMGYFVGGPGGAQQYVRVEDLFAGGGAGGGSPFDVFSGQRLSDLFGQPVRRPQAGSDVAADLQLSFHEAISGVTKQITIDGNTVKVKIPKGVDDRTRIRLKGRGGRGVRGGPPGDAYVTVHVSEPPRICPQRTKPGDHRADHVRGGRPRRRD